MTIEATNVPVLLAASARGIVRAERHERGWTQQAHQPDARVRCLASGGGLAYAGTHGSGVLRSSDGGVTWTSSGLDGIVVSALAVSPHDSRIVYAGTKPASVFVSTDAGASWRELTGFRRIRSRWFWWSPAERPHDAYVQGLAVSSSDPRVLLAGIEAGAVVRSADGGATWSAHRRWASRDCHALCFHARDGSWAYEGGGTGVAVSRDGGQSWRRPRRGLDRRYCWAVAADPEQPQRWYVAASPGARRAHSDQRADAAIFRADERGELHRLAGGLPQPLAAMPYALIAPAGGELYAALGSGELWHTTDVGEHWQRLPVDLGPRLRTCTMLLGAAVHPSCHLDLRVANEQSPIPEGTNQRS